MLPKIELHVHLDGAVRYETLIDLAKKKSLPLPSYDPATLKEQIVTKEPAQLDHLLQGFGKFLPVVCGDPEAIERIAYELCETQSKQGVLYFEVRFSPHFLSNTEPNDTWSSNGPYKGHGDLGPEQVLQCALRGFDRGGRDFGVKWGVILCCMCGYSGWSSSILEMCSKYRDQGVVGIDLAGSAKDDQEYYEETTKAVFVAAKKLGIHRTVHAGEDGYPKGVEKAVDLLHAERIGHGYRVVNDEEIYQKILQGGYHFEVCPFSSWVTGAVDEDWTKHPAKQFAQDKANFSINTDDPTCFDNSMESEFELCRQKLGFTDEILYECQLNAARSAFLSEEEKNQLVNEIKNKWPN